MSEEKAVAVQDPPEGQKPEEFEPNVEEPTASEPPDGEEPEGDDKPERKALGTVTLTLFDDATMNVAWAAVDRLQAFRMMQLGANKFVSGPIC